MNRKVIPLQIRDEYIIGAGGVIGAEGSGNDVALQLEFGAMWKGLVKYVTFRDAFGENPEVLMVTADMMELLKEEKVEPPPMRKRERCRVVYNVPVPKKAKAIAGEMMVTVHGYAVNEDGTQKEAATVGATAYFRVLPAKWAVPETEGFEGPTVAQQMQGQIERIQTDIVEAAKAADAKEAAQKSAEKAEESATMADKVIKDAAAAEALREAAEAARAEAERQRADADAGIVAQATEEADKAAKAAEEAQESKEAIENMTVSAVALPSGQAATVEKTLDGGLVNLCFGLPMGPQGLQGPQGELEDGAVTTLKLADGAVTWPKLAVDARPIGRNLLINSYFVGGGSQQGGGQFPINQRGKTEYVGNGVGLDGWRIVQGSGAKVTLETDCIKLFMPANCVFVQYMDAQPGLIGQTLTWSAMTDDNELLTFTGVFPSSGQLIFDFYYNYKHFQVRFSNYGTYFGFYIYSCNDGITKEIGIVAAKLEVGPNQTFAHKDAAGNWVLNDPPPDHGLELLKCQRHQLFGNLSSLPASKYNNIYRVFIPTPTTLRVKPTIVGNPKVYSVATNQLISGATVTVAYLCNNGVLCNVTGISEPCYLWFDPQDGLDANL